MRFAPTRAGVELSIKCAGGFSIPVKIENISFEAWLNVRIHSECLPGFAADIVCMITLGMLLLTRHAMLLVFDSIFLETPEACFLDMNLITNTCLHFAFTLAACC
jgi:hypothetical protein